MRETKKSAEKFREQTRSPRSPSKTINDRIMWSNLERDVVN
jgi:hypothetical protein